MFLCYALTYHYFKNMHSIKQTCIFFRYNGSRLASEFRVFFALSYIHLKILIFQECRRFGSKVKTNGGLTHSEGSSLSFAKKVWLPFLPFKTSTFSLVANSLLALQMYIPISDIRALSMSRELAIEWSEIDTTFWEIKIPFA